MRPAEQRVEEAKLMLREAEVAAEQVKLALKAISLEEKVAAVGRVMALFGKGAAPITLLRHAQDRPASTRLSTGFDPSRQPVETPQAAH
jgi:hypothetical protein